ncbi:MAG TPA: hypothetical protein VH500_07960 [Nitrososphaeraceae archaeon]|jgi:hypothetical protein
MKNSNKFTASLIVVSSLLLVETTLAPTLAFAQSGFTAQNVNEENLCFESHICRLSNLAQYTSGRDNQVTAFTDQSDNNPQFAASMHGPQGHMCIVEFACVTGGTGGTGAIPSGPGGTGGPGLGGSGGGGRQAGGDAQLCRTDC